ncbi:MAG: DinB family protein [Candidatus Zixiibacteriota bacterium]
MLSATNSERCFVESAWKFALWGQFGAALDMLENSIRACPDSLWHDRARDGEKFLSETRPQEFWYIAYHTLFFLDFYLAETDRGYAPPAPFTLSELDPEGLLPDRVYSKDELLGFLEQGRQKCRIRIGSLTDDTGHKPAAFERPQLTVVELLMYNMRHIQHHAAQLNLLLRQNINSAPRWVGKTKVPLEPGTSLFP